MSQYYLMAQLPSLDGAGEGAPLPITETYFYELCDRFLGKKAARAVHALSLAPERDEATVGYRLPDAWHEGERQLRLALARERAKKLNKPDDTGDESLPDGAVQAARTAVAMEDPMEAERYLSRYRLDYLEGLRPADGFCEDAVFYYGLKLKLVQQFDEAAGRLAYRTIYQAILSGDKQEAEQ